MFEQIHKNESNIDAKIKAKQIIDSFDEFYHSNDTQQIDFFVKLKEMEENIDSDIWNEMKKDEKFTKLWDDIKVLSVKQYREKMQELENIFEKKSLKKEEPELLEKAA